MRSPSPSGFRSLALAIASILLIFISGAAFGFATLMFQHGPDATALREAAEELVWTRPVFTSSDVDTGTSRDPLLVTPVVGWSTRRQLTDILDPQDVAVVVRVPLREFVNLSGRVQRSPETATSDARFIVDGTAVEGMTSIVIDAFTRPRRRYLASSRCPMSR